MWLRPVFYHYYFLYTVNEYSSTRNDIRITNNICDPVENSVREVAVFEPFRTGDNSFYFDVSFLGHRLWPTAFKSTTVHNIVKMTSELFRNIGYSYPTAFGRIIAVRSEVVSYSYAYNTAVTLCIIYKRCL